MKYLILLIALILFCCQQIHAQEIDSIAVIAYWNIGEKQAYELTKKEKTIKDGKVSKNEESKVYISFEVLDSAENNYLLKYKNDSIYVSDLNKNTKAYKDGIEQVLGSVEYHFLTDEYGEFESLQNWEEVRDKILALVKLNISTNKSKAKDEDKKAYEALISFLEDKAFLQNYLLKDIQVLFNDHGYVYAVGDTLKYEEELSMPFGNKIIPANGTFVVEYNEDSNEAIYNTYIKIDPEVGKKAILEVLASLYDKLDLNDQGNMDKFAEETKDATMDIEIKSVVTYDLVSGWVKESFYQRRMIFNDSKENIISVQEQQFKPLSN